MNQIDYLIGLLEQAKEYHSLKETIHFQRIQIAELKAELEECKGTNGKKSVQKAIQEVY